MKPPLLILFLGFSIQLSAQHIFSNKFKNIKSKKHIHIVGTRFFIVPPEGFHTRLGFIGIEKNDSVIIQFLDKPESNYYAGVNSMMKDFSTSTVTIADSGSTKVGDYYAKYIVIDGKLPNKTRNFFIFFGDTGFTAIVNAACQQTDSLSKHDLIQALQSVYFEKDLKYDPFEVAIFTIDQSKSIYKFSDYTSGTFIYTVNGEKILPPDPISSAISIGMPPRTDTTATASDISTGFSNMIVNDPALHIYKVKPLSDQPINGYQADEMVMYGIMDRKQVYIYQMVMVKNKLAIFVQAFIKSELENQLAEVRKLAATIKFK